MTAPADTVFQVNFKTPAGSLLNIYASNGGELDELLEAFEGFIPKITAIESLLTGASNVARTVPVAPPTQQATATAAPAAAPAPAGNEVLCEHGQPAKLIAAGVSKATGKPYRAFYACAQPREAQCNFRLTA